METDAGFVARMRVALAGYETNSTGTRPLVRRGDTDRLCDLAEEVGRLRWVEQAARDYIEAQGLADRAYITGAVDAPHLAALATDAYDLLIDSLAERAQALEAQLAEARALAGELAAALRDGFETLRKAEQYWLSHRHGVGDPMRAQSDWETRVYALLATDAAKGALERREKERAEFRRLLDLATTDQEYWTSEDVDFVTTLAAQQEPADG